MKVTKLWRLAVYLFLVAFVVRIGFVLTLEDRLYWPDEIAFNDIALGLFNGEGYQSTPFRANPVLPFFLASVYQFFGHSYIAPRLIQSLLGSLTAVLVFALVLRLLGYRTAVLSGLWVALFPPLIYISGVFYVECIFTFLIALSIYILHLNSQYLGLRSFMTLILSGIVIGITVLCRPIFLVFLPFAVFFVVSSYKGSITRRVIYATGLVMITSLAIMPWTFRNYMLYGRVLLVSTGTGLFLWKGNNELARGDTQDRYLEPGEGEVWAERLHELAPTRRTELMQKYKVVQHDLEALDEIDQDRYLQKITLALIAKDPGRSVALFVQKVGTLYTPFTEVLAENRTVISVEKRFGLLFIFYPTLILSIIGMLYALGQWRKYLILYLPVIAFTVAYGLMTPASRFRIPIEPYMLVFASYALIGIFEFVRAKLYAKRSYAPLIRWSRSL